ncbi:MAG: hypothetical protein HZA34_02710 [Candidatus Pacebacteria bacterium]|nr:hypothetical protein [Candidatus Paceibacterota bacterium]
MVNKNLDTAEVPTELVEDFTFQLEKMSPQEAIFSIDMHKVREVLLRAGFPENLLSSVVLTNEEDPGSLARYELSKKRILIYQQSFMKALCYVYGYLTKEKMNEDDLVTKVVTSPFFPTNWPYMAMKTLGTDFHRSLLKGNMKRRSKYLKASKQGTLSNTLPAEEQQTRAKEFIKRQLVRALKSEMSWTLAHELEHRRKIFEKRALITTLALTPTLLTTWLVNIFSERLTSIDEGLGVSLFLLSMGLGVFGFVYGRAVEEKFSYDFGDTLFQELSGAIEMNEHVFLDYLDVALMKERTHD